MSHSTTLKKLNVITSPAWNMDIMQMAKEIGTWNTMQRKNDECCFWLEEQAAAEGSDKVKQDKAKLNKTRAIQKTINYIWSTHTALTRRSACHHRDEEG